MFLLILMTPEEKAYLAGIIDGEGSIMLLRFHHNQSHSPCVSIASTSNELLEWVKSKPGIGTIKSKKNYKPDRHENSYTYTAGYDDAINLLHLIQPYLVITSKKVRAEMILNEYKKLTPRNSRHTEDLLRAKNEFYTRFMT
jgi:hypothetical protein